MIKWSQFIIKSSSNLYTSRIWPTKEFIWPLLIQNISLHTLNGGSQQLLQVLFPPGLVCRWRLPGIHNLCMGDHTFTVDETVLLHLHLCKPDFKGVSSAYHKKLFKLQWKKPQVNQSASGIWSKRPCSIFDSFCQTRSNLGQNGLIQWWRYEQRLKSWNNLAERALLCLKIEYLKIVPLHFMPGFNGENPPCHECCVECQCLNSWMPHLFSMIWKPAMDATSTMEAENHWPPEHWPCGH